MNARLCVVVHVAQPPESGNLASGLGAVYLDPQATGGQPGDPVLSIGDALGNPMLDIFTLVPVFKVGELILLGGDDRDQFGRKPDKWDVTIEEFDDIDAAIARVREVER